jgi:pimeloyl-ACP methyl ester carboxylesterase
MASAVQVRRVPKASNSSEVDGTELVMTPDCGHLSFVGQPERFRQEVLRFMD